MILAGGETEGKPLEPIEITDVVDHTSSPSSSSPSARRSPRASISLRQRAASSSADRDALLPAAAAGGGGMTVPNSLFSLNSSGGGVYARIPIPPPSSEDPLTKDYVPPLSPVNGNSHHTNGVNGASTALKLSPSTDEKETESLVKADALGDGLVSTSDSDEEDNATDTAGSGTLYQKSLKSHATWNLVSVIVGAGTLAFPFVMKQCGVVLALFFLALLGYLNVCTLQFLCQCGRRMRSNDRSLENKLITYVSVAEKCYPGVLMKNFVLTGIFLAGFMSILGYFVVLADEIPTLLEHVRGVPPGSDFASSRAFAALISFVLVVPLSLIRYISKLWAFSFFAVFSIMVLVLMIMIRGFQSAVDDEFINTLPKDQNQIVYFNASLEVFSGIGVIAFSYLCHMNIFAIFSELKLTISRQASETKVMNAGAIVCAGSIYALTGVFGYVRFRGAVTSNILQSFAADDVLVLLGRIGLVAVILISIVMIGFPAKRMLIILIFGDPDSVSYAKEGIVSVFLMGIAFGLSLGFQQIHQIWSLTGAVLGTSFSFILPAMFYVKLEKNGRWMADKDSKLALFIAVMGVIFMVIGTEEAVSDFIENPPQF